MDDLNKDDLENLDSENNQDNQDQGDDSNGNDGGDDNGNDNGDDKNNDGDERYKKAFKDQKIRAKKAEDEAKALRAKYEGGGDDKDNGGEGGMSPTDVLALTGAQIFDERDIKSLQSKAKGFGISIPDALKDDVIMSKLRQEQEERSTAEATDTGKNKMQTVRQVLRHYNETLRKATCPTQTTT